MSQSTRRPMAAGNWKMNLTRSSARRLVDELRNLNYTLESVDILVAPPMLLVPTVVKWVSGSTVAVAAQNMHWESKGAFTGEVSAAMVREVGCTHVILGHSERRHVFGETDEWVHRKLVAALENDLVPVLCVGEKLDEREAGRTLEVVGSQLDAALEGVSSEDVLRVVVAYEPVWAIGTGKTATPSDAQEVHAFIRRHLGEGRGSETAERVRILYGGSVTPSTIAGLIVEKDIDGTLVGGASLNAETFVPIVKSSMKR
ncbi:MAG: triose-phosphate isomerase [Deltaproteobacteria bacterium]|nr:triose-phosphate isomerase [Deltaproteobacteria bacterium]